MERAGIAEFLSRDTLQKPVLQASSPPGRMESMPPKYFSSLSFLFVNWSVPLTTGLGEAFGLTLRQNGVSFHVGFIDFSSFFYFRLIS